MPDMALTMLIQKGLYTRIKHPACVALLFYLFSIIIRKPLPFQQFVLPCHVMHPNPNPKKHNKAPLPYDD